MNERDDNLAVGGAQPCDCADVAAYLDGELGAADESIFEAHLSECPPCASALAAQRRLLNLLDAAFGRAQRHGQGGVALPADFARVVTARAQSDMTRVRGRSEKWLAALLSLSLAAVAFALLGRGGWDDVLSPLSAAARSLAAVSRLASHSAAEAVAGAALLLRGLGGYLAQAEPANAPLALAAFACALLLLLRLIAKYHRAELPD